MGCVVTFGTTSCKEDEDETPKQENKSNTNDSKKEESTTLLTPTESGEVMKDIVKNFQDNSSTILDQATSMTSEQLTNLASTIIEYGKNKDNEAWKDTFITAIGSESSEEAFVLLDDVVNKLVKEVGVDMSEMTPEFLVDTFKEWFTPTDELGEGYKEGYKEGESHKALIDAIYDESFKSIPTNSDGLDQMIAYFGTLDKDQQKELANAAVTWANKSEEGDEEWKNGFLAGTGLNEEDQALLREKLDFLAQYKTLIMLGL